MGERKVFQRLTIRFWASTEDDVCLILCEPSLEELADLLSSLSFLCKDAPSDLAVLALSLLQSASASVVPEFGPFSASSLTKVETKIEDIKSEQTCTGFTKGDVDICVDSKRIRRQSENIDNTTVPCSESNVLMHDELAARGLDITEPVGTVKQQGLRSKKKVAKKRLMTNQRKKVKLTDRRILTKGDSVSSDSDAEDKVKTDPVEAKRSIGLEQETAHRFANLKELLLKGKAFPRKRGVRIHSCNLCGKRRLTELTLKWHLTKAHDHRSCNKCRQVFVSPESLEQHVCPMRNLACELCPPPGPLFRSHLGWMKHHRIVHEGVRHVCHLCGLWLSSADTLRQHIYNRHPAAVKRPVAVPPCPICGKVAKNKAAMYEHERRQHNDSFRSGPCTFCGMVLSSKSNLQRHLATVHRGEMAGSTNSTAKSVIKKVEQKTNEEELGPEMKKN